MKMEIDVLSDSENKVDLFLVFREIRIVGQRERLRRKIVKGGMVSALSKAPKQKSHETLLSLTT